MTPTPGHEHARFARPWRGPCAFLTTFAAGAQGPAPAKGVTADQILVGLEGPTDSFSSDEENLGMRLLMAEVNARGGIHGRRLVERSYPRKGGAAIDEGVANARRLIEEDGVFLLFNMGGPAAVRIGPLAMSHQVPYLFPHTALLTADADRYVFTSFPLYAGETAVMFKHLAGTLGLKRLAIVHDENEYGSYFRDRLAQLAPSLGYQMVGAEGSPTASPATSPRRSAGLRAARPEAVILALYPEQAQAVMRAKAALGWRDVRMVATGPAHRRAVPERGGRRGRRHRRLLPVSRPQPGSIRRRARIPAPDGRALSGASAQSLFALRLRVRPPRGRGTRTRGAGPHHGRLRRRLESIRNWDSGGIIPPVSFSKENHHAQRAGFICELKDGRFDPKTGWLEP